MSSNLITNMVHACVICPVHDTWLRNDKLWCSAPIDLAQERTWDIALVAR